MPNSETVHASAVLVGEHALLIRGAAGSGKSQLAWELIEAGGQRRLPFAKLVGDDRVRLFAAGERLLVAPHERIRGMIEMRGLGPRRLDYEGLAVVGLVVDLGAADAARFPAPQAAETEILGVSLSRLPVGAGEAAFPLVLARLSSTAAA